MLILELLELPLQREGVDTVVLVDGGTDSLMRGDEQALGSPQEDMLSIAGVSALTGIDDDHKLLACTSPISYVSLSPPNDSLKNLNLSPPTHLIAGLIT